MSMDNLQFMKEQLQMVYDKGTSLYLENRKVTPMELAWTCCVSESDVYMPDYIHGENGGLSEIRYNKIRNT